MKEITTKVAKEIISHEAIVRQAYRDSRGIWTWGIGITSAAGIDPRQYIGRPQPMEKVISAFVDVLRRQYLPDVLRAFGGVELSEHELAAALSFHYNTGAIGRAKWVDDVLDGRRDKARKNFMNWRSPPEIFERRKKERDLFFDGRWASDGTALEYTRMRPSGTPDWKSARRVDITRALEAALRSSGDGISEHGRGGEPFEADQMGFPQETRLPRWIRRVFRWWR